MRALLLCLILLVTPSWAMADVIVNEVLANAPGSVEPLEWVELYNTSPSPVNLDFYTMYVAGETSTNFIIGEWIPGESYMVVCKNLLDFEAEWGDGTGVWGDNPEESYVISVHSFTLYNDEGSVQVASATNDVSELAWTEVGLDGRSWERRTPSSAAVTQCADPNLSTPGRVNSVTPLDFDLAFAAVDVSKDDDETLLELTIRNAGLTEVSSSELEIAYFDSGEPDSLGGHIATIDIEPLDSGDQTTVSQSVSLFGVYERLIARLPNDDRVFNNVAVFVAPGDEYPPLMLSEFFANPTNPYTVEWIEIANVSDDPVGLTGWQIGDSLTLRTIDAGTNELSPGEYAVLTGDVNSFNFNYPSFTGWVFEVSGLPTLNNTSDVVRLVDSLGIVADRYQYTTVWDENSTWARASDNGEFGRWGRSADVGGTPGEENAVQFTGDPNASLDITITPRVFSPNGDGYQDSCEIRVLTAPAESYTLKIYDRDGRLRRTFEDESSVFDERYMWDGRDDGYQHLPVGVYILFFEAGGLESQKQTIVIAR